MIDPQIKSYVDSAITQAQNAALYGTTNASYHTHNGIDSPKLPTSIIAGTNVTISPSSGTGAVTINASEPTIATTGNSANNVYTNSSGHVQLHLLSIALSGGISGGGSGTANFLVNSSVVQETAITVGSGLLVQHTVMLVGFVPAGATYEVTTATTGGGTCIIGWWQIITF
jgi:hypothetical protein